MSKHLIFIIHCLFTFVFISCRSDEERFEVINKLRALGVNPSVSLFPIDQLQKNPLQTELSVYIALPKGQQITSIENFDDPKASFSLFKYQQVDSSSLTYQQVGPLQIASFKVNVKTPVLSELEIPAYQSYIKLRYAFTVKAGEEAEQIVGDLLVLASNSPLVAYHTEIPSLSIASPDSAVISHYHASPLSLAAQIDKKVDETVKVLWFVSSGRLKNNQSKNTEWTDIEIGQQSLIAVIFSKKTWRFQIAYREIAIF